MILRIFYALMGAIAGLICGLAWDLLLDGRAVDLSIWPPAGFISARLALWGLGGMAAGALMVVPDEAPVDNHRYYSMVYPPLVEMQPARCAWCEGQGRTLLFFRCTVCGGQGSVLAIRPKKKCAWCGGLGRRFLFCRCPACGGAGWLQPNPHVH